jgi:hypothetical protein
MVTRVMIYWMQIVTDSDQDSAQINTYIVQNREVLDGDIDQDSELLGTNSGQVSGLLDT